MKLKQMTNDRGRAVPNQFIITDGGKVFFQSYESIIAIKEAGKVTLDITCWDYSKTTGKYRNQFLGEDKRTTEKKIKDGEYQLADLNKGE